jgi:hypothetical protein
MLQGFGTFTVGRQTENSLKERAVPAAMANSRWAGVQPALTSDGSGT